MNTLMTPRNSLIGLEGDRKSINYELPIDTYMVLKELARRRGWSMSEASRQGITLLFEQNKDIVDVLLSDAHAAD